MNTPSGLPETVGLVAGWGTFPIVVARHLKRCGIRVCCLGIKDHASGELPSLCDEYRPIGLAKLGAAVRFFRRSGVRVATMAGKIHKVRLFHRWHWLHHLPDAYGVQTFFPHYITMTRDRKDDTILTTIVDAFGNKGIEMAPATDLVPGLLTAAGQLSGSTLNRGQKRDVAFGWELAREMGRLDVGQSVVVKGRAVLAVEAVEGTDLCIERAGQICPTGGFTVVKIAKPNQDMRFDVPTIGIGTLKMLHQAGGRVLAIEADRTILLDREEVIRFANQQGIQLIALHAADARAYAQAA